MMFMMFMHITWLTSYILSEGLSTPYDSKLLDSGRLYQIGELLQQTKRAEPITQLEPKIAQRTAYPKRLSPPPTSLKIFTH